MALNRRQPTDTPQKDYLPNLDKGDYEARLVTVADLGLQKVEWDGEFKGNYQHIALQFEVIGQGQLDDDGKYQPRVLWTRPIKVFANKMSNAELEYYRAFDPSATSDQVPDWEAQALKPVTLTINNIKSKKNPDRVYDSIVSVVRIPDKYADDVGAAVTEFGISDADNATDPLHERLFALPRQLFDDRIREDSEEY